MLACLPDFIESLCLYFYHANKIHPEHLGLSHSIPVANISSDKTPFWHIRCSCYAGPTYHLFTPANPVFILTWYFCQLIYMVKQFFLGNVKTHRNFTNFDRSEMNILRKKMYVNSVWESFSILGRSLPKIASLSVMVATIGHTSAAVLFVLLKYINILEDKFVFYFQWAFKTISEVAVCIDRAQVRKE